MDRAKLDSIRQACPAILPSLLQCDFGNLQREVEKVAAADVTALHLDVMDGVFVPNLTYGMPIVAGLRRYTELPLDVHLMIQDPLKYAQPMVDAGADILTFHVEAVDDPVEVAGRIREMGVGVGVAVNPESDFQPALDCAAEVDMVLVMSVQAGFGGQSFRPVALERIEQLRQAYPELLLQIDGGINAETIGAARAAGCDLFVVGSAIFGQSDYGQAIKALNAAMQQDQGVEP